jgi:putative DNA topoisomerase
MSNDTFLEPQSLGVPCPRCQRELQLKKGRYGLFVGCSGYPDCDYMTAADFDPGTDVACPNCQHGKLVQKTSRFGNSFYACDQYPHCKFSVNLPPVAEACPKCGFALLLKKRSSRGERLICAQAECDYKSTMS